jgi:hypothetical protein
MPFYRIILFILFLISSSAFGQVNYNYQSPLDIPLVLAANFGELRPHHFHMGLDFKTNSKEGYNIRSIQKGYVSRVKVSRSGYGKVVYVDHENGHTSVYAHCSSFQGQIDSLVRKVQEREQNAEIEIYLKKDEIKVNRGQIIALSGNTGGSSGPHLHFELRETGTEIGLNPLLFGFNLADHQAPELRSIKVSAIDSNGFTVPGKSIIVPVKRTKEGFYSPTVPISLPSHFCSKSGGIGFAFEVIDRFDGAQNNCGLYASDLRINDKPIFTTKIDRIPFDESRHINCHKDHGEFLKGKDFHRCFKTAENPLEIYKSIDQGIVNVQPGQQFDIVYKAWDVKNNSSVLRFSLVIESGPIADDNNFPQQIYFTPDDKIDVTNGTVFISAEPNTLYEPLKKQYSLEPPYFFGENRIPIQRPLEIQIPSSSTKKQYLEMYDEKGRSKSITTEYRDGYLIARPKNLGRFTIKTDTIAPSILPLDLNSSQLKWRVKENETDIFDYDLFIDGQWILLEYESKADLLFASKPKGLVGNHEVILIVIDSCGNKQDWSNKVLFK